MGWFWDSHQKQLTGKEDLSVPIARRRRANRGELLALSPCRWCAKRAREGGKGTNHQKKWPHLRRGRSFVRVSLKTAHSTFAFFHEGGKHYEEPFRCLIRQRRPSGIVKRRGKRDREKGGFFPLHMAHHHRRRRRHQPIPTAAPRELHGRPAGMAGQIAEASLAVTSQRVPHKFSPAGLRAS